MRAQLVENINFKRGIGSKKSLDVGLNHLLKELDNNALGALITYRDQGYKKLNWFENQDGHRITKNGVDYIVKIDPFLKNTIWFGQFHYSGDDDKAVVDEMNQEGYAGMHAYYAFTDAQDGFFIAYSKIPLPAADTIDKDDYDY